MHLVLICALAAFAEILLVVVGILAALITLTTLLTAFGNRGVLVAGVVMILSWGLAFGLWFIWPIPLPI